MYAYKLKIHNRFRPRLFLHFYLLYRPPFIQMIHIDPLIKVPYISNSQSGFMQLSATCSNSSAVYVTCPDLLCGTRVRTTTQELREVC